MQLVSREVLFDVMSNKKPITLSKSINESDSSAFQTFKKKATDTYQKSANMDMFSNAMLKYLNNNKTDIRYVGQGSSRIVFALADGTALKLAKTKAGIAQNKQEAKTCMNPLMKYEIFPDFYDADKSKWLSLNCELCAKADRSDFKDLFFAQPIAISNTISFILKMKLEDQALKQAYDHFMSITNPANAKVVQHLIDNQTEADHALKSLLEFYRKNGEDELLLGDVEEIENWGITIRNDQKVLVIIDAGFNEQVYQDFYKED